jgi:hypothetical protein
MACYALLSERQLPVSKGHEILALVIVVLAVSDALDP